MRIGAGMPDPPERVSGSPSCCALEMSQKMPAAHIRCRRHGIDIRQSTGGVDPLSMEPDG